MVIKHNMAAMNAQNRLKGNQKKIEGNLEKLSSGYKINRSADDASGLGISEKMRCTITGIEQGTENTEDGIGLVRTAEGAMAEIHDILNRMKELCVQSANGTYEDAVDREAIQKEIQALVAEVDRIVEGTDFNGIPLLCREDIVTHWDWIEQEIFPLTDQTKKDYSSTIDAEVTGNIDAFTGSVIGSSSYSSDRFELPSDALSVADSELPKTISVAVTYYDDQNSDVGSPLITTKEYVIEVVSADEVYGKVFTYDADGNLTGTTSTPYANNVVKTQYDYLKGSDGFPYVGGTAGYTLDSSQVSAIMSELMNSTAYGVSLGGSTGIDQYSAYSTIISRISSGDPAYTADYADIVYNPSASNFYDRLTFPNGKTYQDYISAADCYSTGSYYNGMTGTDSYENPTNTGRIIGLEVNTSSSTITTRQPDGFDYTTLSSTTDLQNGAIDLMGAGSAAEPSHTEVGIGDIFPTAAELLNGTYNPSDFIISVDKVTETHYLNDVFWKDDKETYNYVVLQNPVNSAVSSLFPDTTIVWVDPNKTKREWVEQLVDVMESDLGVDVNRKLDSVNHLFIDDNVTDKYTIQVQTFIHTTYYWEQEDPVYDEVYGPDPIILQVADQNEDFDRVYVEIENMRPDVVELETVDASNQNQASDSIKTIEELINKVSTYRGDMGAYDNRLGHTLGKNRVTTENLTEAESKIRDTDIAEEMMKYTAHNILIQSSQSMLAQANALPEGILQLLG